MSRPDLLALSPDAVAVLSNRGLVKRALREIEAGEGPSLEESRDGVVTGRFGDGALARLPPGVALRDAPCSCGAVTTCRHRVAVALAYRAWHAARSGGAPGPSSAVAWSPAAVSDEALRKALGKRVFERARALVRAGLLVEVRRPARGDADRPPEARLPTCSVRFLVPEDLAYARCDCAAAGCAHVAVAVWAFREADARDPEASLVHVELGAAPGAVVEASPLAQALALGHGLLVEGVVNVRPALAGRFARVRAALEAGGLTWPLTIVEDLEEALAAYRDRSARYRPAVVSGLITELAARQWASGSRGELPARFVLGAGEARETLLDHVRLVSLGARVDADGTARDVEVYLADPETGLVLVFRKRFTYAAGEEPEDGPALAARNAAPRVKLGLLAHGQLVSRAVKRLANRDLVLASGRMGRTSVTLQAGDWETLPEPILLTDVAAHGATLRARPPRLLRPRILAEALHVVAVGEVGPVHYAPGEQAVIARLTDATGSPIRLRRRYRSAAPHALEALAAALTEPGRRLRFVSGEVRHGAGGIEIDPVALVTDRVVVPDFEPPASGLALPVGGELPPPSPLVAALDAAGSCLDEAAHQGLSRLPGPWAGRLLEAASGLEAVGLKEASCRTQLLAECWRAAQGVSAPEPSLRAARAWCSASVRIALTREAL